MSKILIMDEWIKALQEDKNLGGSLNAEGIACILYGLYEYNVSGERPDLGAIFGGNYGILNFAMPGLYTQIDKMKGINRGQKTSKYDNEAIQELASLGFGPKDICERLGIDPSKAKSLASNKGYKAGRAIYKGQEQEDKENPPGTFGF